LLGIPIGSVIINDRMGAKWHDDVQYAVIDGKQRIVTITMFLEGDLRVPGEWFDMPGEVSFSEIPIAIQRGISNRGFPCLMGFLPTLESEREVFELVNFGGVPQGESD
jgi:hypothetical protein